MDIQALAGSTGLLATGVGGLPGATLPGSGNDDVSDAFGLGRDDFFKLFLSQLANQDPMNPVDDKQMIAQLAQFSMIDTMQAMKKALSGTQLAQSSSLLGKSVQGLDIGGAPIEGVVDRVVQADGELLLMIGDRAIRPESVNFVGPAPVVTAPATAPIVIAPATAPVVTAPATAPAAPPPAGNPPPATPPA